MTSLLFVVGFGLSGELEVTRSLAAHPAIVLGVHRYRELWQGRVDELGPELFERDRFLDLTDGLTTLTPEDPRWAAHYEAMAGHWDTAEYVGDMTTEVRLMQTWERLPDARFACVVRDPLATALARERRAQDNAARGGGELRPPGAAARASAAGWNRAGGRIRRAARQRPDRVRVLEHDRLLSDPEGTSLNSLLRWLDLEDTPESDDAFGAAHRRYLDDLLVPAPELPAEDLAHIDATADHALWRDLQALAV